MAEPQKKRRKFRLVYRRSSTALKCVVLAAIILCTVCLMFLRGRLLSEKAQSSDLRTQAAELERENEKIRKDTEDLDTVDGVKRLAMELLELVAPDTIIFQTDESNPE